VAVLRLQPLENRVPGTLIHSFPISDDCDDDDDAFFVRNSFLVTPAFKKKKIEGEGRRRRKKKKEKNAPFRDAFAGTARENK